MKRRAIFAGLAAGVLAMLLACATVPEPGGPDNALVTGSFIIDFPDGFFGQADRTFRSGVKLYFANVRTSKTFSLLTGQEGYFSYLSNGSDKYALIAYAMSTNETGQQTEFGGEVMRGFPTTPGKVVYLGHFTASFTKPNKTTRQALGQATTFWDYEKAVTQKWEDDLLLQYLRETSPDSAWLERELLRQGSYTLSK